MGLATTEIIERVQAEFGPDGEEADLEAKDPWFRVKPEALRRVCEWLQYDPAVRFDMLHNVSGVDFPDDQKIQVVYHFESVGYGHTTVLKVDLPRDAAEVDSLADMWAGADWHERETFDLLGVTFKDHPNLKRILCAEDWVGHPLRKDYEWPESYHGIPCGPYVEEFANVPPAHDTWAADAEAMEEGGSS